MIILYSLLLAAVFAVLLAGCIWWLIKMDVFGPVFIPFMLAVICGFCLLGCIIYPIAYVADRSNCRAWSHNTGRPVKFVRYPSLSYECLTQTHDGKWINKDRIGDYNK
jgi:hypothetical protein